MSTVDVFNRNLRTLTAFGHLLDVGQARPSALDLRHQVGAGIYTMIAINDALADLMRQGYVEASGDGYKRVGTVESYRLEHDPSNSVTRNAI